jgi:hypothetical protein
LKRASAGQAPGIAAPPASGEKAKAAADEEPPTADMADKAHKVYQNVVALYGEKDQLAIDTRLRWQEAQAQHRATRPLAAQLGGLDRRVAACERKLEVHKAAAEKLRAEYLNLQTKMGEAAEHLDKAQEDLEEARLARSELVATPKVNFDEIFWAKLGLKPPTQGGEKRNQAIQHFQDSISVLQALQAAEEAEEEEEDEDMKGTAEGQDATDQANLESSPLASDDRGTATPQDEASTAEAIASQATARAEKASKAAKEAMDLASKAEAARETAVATALKAKKDKDAEEAKARAAAAARADANRIASEGAEADRGRQELPEPTARRGNADKSSRSPIRAAPPRG